MTADTGKPDGERTARAAILLDASGDIWVEDTTGDGMWLCLTDPNGIRSLRYNVHELNREQLEATFGPVREPTWQPLPNGPAPR